jgi:hypothetical protein
MALVLLDSLMVVTFSASIYRRGSDIECIPVISDAFA